MTQRAEDQTTIDARTARANAKRVRIGRRNLALPCGTPVWSIARRARLMSVAMRNRWAQHGHRDKPGDSCLKCAATYVRMEERGTA